MSIWPSWMLFGIRLRNINPAPSLTLARIRFKQSKCTRKSRTKEGRIRRAARLQTGNGRRYSPSQMTLLINSLLVIYIVVALLMLLFILMQRPRSEGLGAAFGGGLTENIFGAQTTNVLVKITAWLASIFFALTFVLSVLYAHKATGDRSLRSELMKQQTSAAPTASPANSAASASVAPNSGTGALPAGSVKPVASPATTPPIASSAAPSASAKPK
jgi:preprotein translocase subunit SecG